MGGPSRQRLEFQLNVATAGRLSLPPNMQYRLEREIKYRAQALGLKVYGIRFNRNRLELDVLLQSNMVKVNIERALYGAINGLIKREMPHLVRKNRGGGPSGSFYG